MLNDRQLMEAYKKIEESEGADYGTKKPETKTEPGVQDAPKEFKAEDKKIDTPAENKRDAGASKAPEKFDGNKETVGKAANDKNEPGAKNAPKAFESLEDYKKRLRGALGIPLDSELNQGNKGIEK
jgi:hypothetical protein